MMNGRGKSDSAIVAERPNSRSFRATMQAAGRHPRTRWFGHECILHNDEKLGVGEDLSNPRDVGQRHRRVRCGDPKHADQAGLLITEDLQGIQCGIEEASTFQSRASSLTCSSLAQLRQPGRSPSAPRGRRFAGCTKTRSAM
jgi:hypothetical protein